MPPSSSLCDPPATAGLRLQLMEAILRADATLLVRLAGVLQEMGREPRSETPPGPPGGDSGARTSCP